MLVKEEKKSGFSSSGSIFLIMGLRIAYLSLRVFEMASLKIISTLFLHVNLIGVEGGVMRFEKNRRKQNPLEHSNLEEPAA